MRDAGYILDMSLAHGFRRLLLVTDGARGLASSVRTAQMLAPHAEHVHWLCVAGPALGLDQLQEASADFLESIQRQIGDWQAQRPGLGAAHSLTVGLGAPHVVSLAERIGADLVLLAPLREHPARERANLALRLTSRHPRHVVSVGARVPPTRDTGGPRRVVLALDADGEGLPALADFAGQLSPDIEVLAVAAEVGELRRAELEAKLRARVPGRAPPVQGLEAPTTSLAEAVDALAVDHDADLVVAAADAVSTLEALALGFFSADALQHAACPTLVLPRTHPPPPLLRERLAASDALVLPGHSPRVCVERVGAFGRSAPAQGESLVVLDRGAEGPPLQHAHGIVTIPQVDLARRDGPRGILLETRGALPESALVRLIPVARPLVLIDATLDDLPHGSLAARAPHVQLVFVRMRHNMGLEELRQRLGAYVDVLGLPVLIDASAWLDDAGAEDIPQLVDGQRLLRVSHALICAGARVQAIVTKHQRLHSHACEVFTERTWASQAPPPSPSPKAFGPCRDLQSALDLHSASELTPGHRVRLELDNAAARRAVLERIQQARERVHIQCYIVEDDAVTEELAAALRAAAARGVQVRLLVDAVYSLHGAFGRTNQALTRLGATPGVSVRAFRPVTGLPTLSALKRRNHRKFLIFDGHTAVITGRNLGAPYYRGFGEAALSVQSQYRDVPWLDCGAEFAGPLVSELERSFLREWQRAGGDAYPVPSCGSAGPVQARLVLHDGLRDTRTFDAQLNLIRHAQRELTILNTFPLVIEAQRALLDAIGRGVRVRILFGNVRPSYGAGIPFAGGRFRRLADQLVRARLDPVVQAGGEVFEYALSALPQWESTLGQVFPHVHAKLLLRDGEDVAVGSANLDVTAAYWESEAMLIVHDAVFARSVAAQVAPLFETSRLLDRDALSFRAEAAQRAWLSHYWPSLLG